MTALFKTTAPALVIIIAWLLWFIAEAYLIDAGMNALSWYAYRVIVLFAILSALYSGVLIYLSDTHRRVRWLLAGVLCPCLLSFFIHALFWYRNSDIVPEDLVNDFGLCGEAMLVSIPLSAYLKHLRDDDNH